MTIDYQKLSEIPIQLLLAKWGVETEATAKGFKSTCPLPQHEGGKNTFSVVTDKNFWQCFSPKCQEARGGKKGGNIINLVMAHEGISDYRKAAELLSSWFPAENPKKEAPREVVQEDAPIAHPNPEVVSIKAERFMDVLDRKLDAEFKPVLLLFTSDTAGFSDEERLDTILLKLKKIVKREVLESYRNGQASEKKAS